MTGILPGLTPPRVTITKLRSRQNGIARFAASCDCGQTTILSVPVAQATGSATGGYQCDGCGLAHRFAITVQANGGPTR